MRKFGGAEERMQRWFSKLFAVLVILQVCLDFINSGTVPVPGDLPVQQRVGYEGDTPSVISGATSIGGGGGGGILFGMRCMLVLMSVYVLAFVELNPLPHVRPLHHQ